MFDFASSELLLIAIVALLVIGPKELPNALRHVGRMAGKARAMTRHLRSGFDEMVRQAELEEMEKEWRRENARILAETAGAPFPDPHPPPADEDAAPADPLAPAPPPPPAAASSPAAPDDTPAPDDVAPTARSGAAS